MDEENRKILVSQQKQKASRFLSQADEMLGMEYWDLAANRFYYACFHAVQGLFISKGISAHTHAGMIQQFSLHFVKTRMVDMHYGSFLARMMQLRQKADYNCAYDISEEEVKETATLAHEFIEVIGNL
ncbi:MAG: HEPN domain-containing protein [Prevotella sp.]|nr:HEPN domain-containing protein [Prevotella sp.]